MLWRVHTRPSDGTSREAALRLFREGHWATRSGEEVVLIQAPDGTRFWIDTLFRTCTCQEPHALPCIHLQGYCALLAEQRAYDQTLEAAYAAEYDPWADTLTNDRTERLLREIGVCEF